MAFAINQILIKNLTSAPLPVQAVFEGGIRGRQFSQVIQVGKSIDLGPIANYAEVSRNAEIQNLVAKGKISISYVPGTTDLVPMPGMEETVTGRFVAVAYRIPFTAGAGTSLDITLYNANSPRVRIIDAFVLVSTAVASSVATLRTATGGAGSALSQSLSCAATGTVRSTTTTASSSIAVGSTMVLRLSGGATLPGGEFVALADNS